MSRSVCDLAIKTITFKTPALMVRLEDTNSFELQDKISQGLVVSKGYPGLPSMPAIEFSIESTNNDLCHVFLQHLY